MIDKLIEQIGGRERLEALIYDEDCRATVAEQEALAQIALAVLDAQEKPRGWLTWHAIPPTWSDPGGGGEYLAFHEMKPSVHSDDGTDAWPVFDIPPAASVPDRWTHISKQMPEEDDFLVFTKKEVWFKGEQITKGFVCEAWLDEGKFFTNTPYDAPMELEGVTHWMPKPAGPAHGEIDG